MTWLQTSEYATRVAEDGHKSLIVKFTGSLLSGVNNYYAVYEDGTTEQFRNNELVNMCRSFLPISKHYYDTKEKVFAYSLDEVIELLKRR